MAVVEYSGECRTLLTTARYAQHWNFVGRSPEDLARKRGVLHAHCRDIGHDPEITPSSHVVLTAYHDFVATTALAEEGLDLAIIYLRPRSPCRAHTARRRADHAGLARGRGRGSQSGSFMAGLAGPGTLRDSCASLHTPVGWARSRSTRRSTAAIPCCHF